MKQKISLIYEINTRVWLKELSNKNKVEIKLDNIPEDEVLRLKKLGFDAIWLMGVWLSSKKGKKISLCNSHLIRELKNVLPDLKSEDIACSPYSIAGYEINSCLGDRQSILNFKERLNKHGIKLILDFVPNHLALDHPWVETNPDFFIKGTKESLMENPELFFIVDDSEVILAYGKDRYFPPWIDVAQLNYFNPQTRKAMKDILLDVAMLCDGVRCDMAMLILKSIQKEIWGQCVFNNNKFKEPKLEFWAEAIPDVKKSNSDFIFIAEVYWGLEPELLSLGFDYVYDKEFYNALRYNNIERVKTTFSEQISLKNKRLSFIENHDEDRAVTAFCGKKLKAAAFAMMLAPGAHLFHQGQLEGYKIKQAVHLFRKPEELIDPEILSFYKKLMSILKTIRQDDLLWDLLDFFPVREEDTSYKNFIGLLSKKYLAVINYSDSPSQCYFNLNIKDTPSKKLVLKDIFSNMKIISKGFYLDMEPYDFCLFRIDS